MKENRIVTNNGSSIVLYTTDDGDTQLGVKLDKDSVWLNREQIAQLYGRDYKTIAKHINNALREELEGSRKICDTQEIWQTRGLYTNAKDRLLQS